eukprot:821425-Rhodomonas_salina.1
MYAERAKLLEQGREARGEEPRGLGNAPLLPTFVSTLLPLALPADSSLLTPHSSLLTPPRTHGSSHLSPSPVLTLVLLLPDDVDSGRERLRSMDDDAGEGFDDDFHSQMSGFVKQLQAVQ